MTQIPTRSRDLVKQRDRFLCVRCGVKGAHWHHRRSRSIWDDHTHCTCNGIWVCTKCHEWIHQNPYLARVSGWIVSRHHAPHDRPVETVLGRMNLDCDGGFTWTDPVWQQKFMTPPKL